MRMFRLGSPRKSWSINPVKIRTNWLSSIVKTLWKLTEQSGSCWSTRDLTRFQTMGIRSLYGWAEKSSVDPQHCLDTLIILLVLQTTRGHEFVKQLISGSVADSVNAQGGSCALNQRWSKPGSKGRPLLKICVQNPWSALNYWWTWDVPKLIHKLSLLTQLNSIQWKSLVLVPLISIASRGQCLSMRTMLSTCVQGLDFPWIPMRSWLILWILMVCITELFRLLLPVTGQFNSTQLKSTDHETPQVLHW